MPSSTTSARLPVRIAHPSRPQLDHLDDAYFHMLRSCGYTALYLQDSPFDGITGNVAQFYRDFHLISLFDIARSYEKSRYQDYINAVCRRAAKHGVRTFLQSHEPRMPYYAWSSTPPEWRGHGGWPHQGNSHIAYCWSVPESVAYWKQMAIDALGALPEISGVIVSFMDNEAVPCDQRCPRCKGTKVVDMMRDVLGTYAKIGHARRDDFFLAVIDWWIELDSLKQLRAVSELPIHIIGHSCRGISQVIDGEKVPGQVVDMTMVTGELSDLFIQRKAALKEVGFNFMDRVPWSHALENWWLPAPPNPSYAADKLKNLDAQGDLVGWFDFDCAGIEPGSISRTMAAWSADPDADAATLVERSLRSIWSDRYPQIIDAYARFAAAMKRYPIAYADAEAMDVSGRHLALQIPLFGPWFLEDFTYYDTLHTANYFAPWNLITKTSIAYLLPKVSSVAEGLHDAYERLPDSPNASPDIRREIDIFEIYWRQFRSIAGYLKLAKVKLDHLHGKIPDADFVTAVRTIAASELENQGPTEKWLARNPGGFHNPCHHLLGKLQACWPELAFEPDMLSPKRKSLERLVEFKIGPPLPLMKRTTTVSY